MSHDDRTAEVLQGLVAWLDGTAGGSTHEVSGVERPSAGYSSETLLVDVRRSDGGGVHEDRIVLKLPPTGPAIFPSYDFALQARVQEVVAAAGIPTAVPARAESDPRWLGVPFLTMPAVEGHICGEVPALDRRLSAAGPAAAAGLHASLVRLLADIHRVDWRAAGLGDAVPRRDHAAELDHWREYLAWYADGTVLVPALERAIDWCEAHRPAGEPEPSLLWGDVRLENVIVDDTWQPRAVLDWEMAGIGAAEHDLAWLLTLQATQDALVGRTVAGFLDRDEAVRVYEAHLGRPVRDLAWYEVLAAVRSTAILSRIGHLNDQRGVPNFFPVADNPVLDLLSARIEQAA